MPDLWESLRRPLPTWYDDATFGIFIHWGAYSVPAWAEPSGALGTVPDEEWFAHNAYAEWYYNTIRIEGSPAAEHHREAHGGRPYDDFLDQWRAERFDPARWAELFASAGADYVVPTTKHHDGIALWDAPGTGDRNTVRRGPRRDLVGLLADAVRERGIRFGVYYSGGLDWSITDLPPHRRHDDVSGIRPRDAAYNLYAYEHVADLIDRYEPDVLWNDIDWPDAGKRRGAFSLYELFSHFYARRPEGVINDRWGIPFSDFATSEYEFHRESEGAGPWENCRGLGFSFGYNAVEGPSHTLSPAQLARHWSDVVARGGRLLLNVGPTAAGEIPELQAATLRGFGAWSAPLKPHLAERRPWAPDVVGSAWVRGWAAGDARVVVADADEVRVRLDDGGPADASALGASEATVTAGELVLRRAPGSDLPAVAVLRAG